MTKREQFLQLKSVILVHVNLLRNIVHQVAASGNAKKSGKNTSRGYNMMLIVMVHSANCARHIEGRLNKLVDNVP